MTEWLVVVAVLLAVVIELLVISGQVSKIYSNAEAYYLMKVRPTTLSCENVEHPYSEKFSDDPDLYYELIPNLRFSCTINNKTIVQATNTLGFRDNEFTVAKPADTVRILAMGDSFTYGWLVNLNDTWVKVLESMLNQKSAKHTEVLNLGVAGYDIWNVANLLSKRAVRFSPDLVISSFIENDVTPESEINQYGIPRYIELTDNSTYVELFLNKSFSLIRKSYSGRFIIALFPLKYTETLTRMASIYNIEVCDLRSIYADGYNNPIYWQAESGHPTELAYRLVANRLKECIQ
jgi:lysophospholipase L1-like esterase